MFLPLSIPSFILFYHYNKPAPLLKSVPEKKQKTSRVLPNTFPLPTCSIVTLFYLFFSTRLLPQNAPSRDAPILGVGVKRCQHTHVRRWSRKRLKDEYILFTSDKTKTTISSTWNKKATQNTKIQQSSAHPILLDYQIWRDLMTTTVFIFNFIIFLINSHFFFCGKRRLPAGLAPRVVGFSLLWNGLSRLNLY